MVVDDDRVVVELLTMLIADEQGLVLVHVAPDLASARSCTTQDVDVVLLDHDLPDGEAADLLPHLRATWPQARVVLHTSRQDALARHRLLRTDGYAVKGADWPALLGQLRTV